MPRSHRWILLSSILLVIALIGACFDEPTAPEPTREGVDEPSLAFLAPGGAAKNWDEGDFINVEVTGSPGASVLSAIGAAADEWNTYVFDLDGHYNDLPHVSDDPKTTTQSTPKIRIDYSEDGTWGWCGASEGWDGTDVWVLSISKKNERDSCGGRIVQDLEGVVAHEMSHAFGFGHLDTDATYWCVANVPATGNLNHHPELGSIGV
jgi:hypothetical protein